MKKLFGLLTCMLLGTALLAQETDSKHRFGLRITPQPCWWVSGDKNNIPAGSVFGFGFGLNYEIRLTNTAFFLTGIGGDFEGGIYSLKKEPGVYDPAYWLNESGEFVKPDAPKTAGTIGYELKSRKINTTYATIPLLLKLKTGETEGVPFRYFGVFGVELGVRLNAEATDTYYGYVDYKTGLPIYHKGEFTESDINLNDEAGLIPLRMGLNVGAGVEYNISKSTSMFLSLNYFRSFTNFMDKESDFTIYGFDGSNYKFIRQNLKLSAIRINIGLMF
jgi:hypothetical protein